MTKLDWLQLKSKKQYSLELLFEFWITFKKDNYKEISLDEFKQLIEVYATSGGSINQQRIYEYFDQRFNVIKIFNKENQLIKEI